MSQQFEAAVVVPLDAAAAFALAHSVGDLRVGWDRTLTQRRLVRGARQPGLDAIVFERTPEGRRMLLRTETWFPPQSSSARMIKGPVWLAEYGEGIHLTPLAPADSGTAGPGSARTRVVFKVTFALPRLLAPGLSERVVVQRLRREVESRAADFVSAAADPARTERLRRGQASPRAE